MAPSTRKIRNRLEALAHELDDAYQASCEADRDDGWSRRHIRVLMAEEEAMRQILDELSSRDDDESEGWRRVEEEFDAAVGRLERSLHKARQRRQPRRGERRNGGSGARANILSRQRLQSHAN
jgi:uncharacterized protein YdaU (DUF1376 family)